MSATLVLIVIIVWIGNMECAADECPSVVGNGTGGRLWWLESDYSTVGNGSDLQRHMYIVGRRHRWPIAISSYGLDVKPAQPTSLIPDSLSKPYSMASTSGTAATPPVVTIWNCYIQPNGTNWHFLCTNQLISKQTSEQPIGADDLTFKPVPTAQYAFVAIAPRLDRSKVFINGLGKDWSLNSDSADYLGAAKNFTTDFSDQQWAQVVSIMDYTGKSDTTTGHIVLLNVTDRPMYCLIPIDSKPSVECAGDELKPLFGHCFPTTRPPISTAAPNDSAISTGAGVGHDSTITEATVQSSFTTAGPKAMASSDDSESGFKTIHFIVVVIVVAICVVLGIAIAFMFAKPQPPHPPPPPQQQQPPPPPADPQPRMRVFSQTATKQLAKDIANIGRVAAEPIVREFINALPLKDRDDFAEDPDSSMANEVWLEIIARDVLLACSEHTAAEVALAFRRWWEYERYYTDIWD